MSKIAKISVEKFDSKEQILYDFDKSKGLKDNVNTICKKIGLPESKVYGLKYLPTKTSEKNHYVSESNFEEIKHSDCLKVVFSVKYIVGRIIKNIREDNLDLRRISFEDISKLSLDPAFVEELAQSGKAKILVDVFINDHLYSYEQLGLLQTVLHLFSLGLIRDTSQNILQKALNILKNSDTTDKELRFTLSLLHKILVNPSEAFDPWKERIVRDIPITELNPYTWRASAKDLQYSALLVINTIIKVCKGDKKQQLIKEMNLRRTRENIYNHIIMEGDLDKNMEHELYVLQTYLLSLFSEALNSKIDLDGNIFFRRQEFELGREDMRRITILMDFDESTSYPQSHHQQHPSIENLITFNAISIRDSPRISLASVRSEESLIRTSTSKRISSAARHCSESEHHDNTISHLTFEALRHYKHLHPMNFYQSQIEEQLYEPGIFVTSEKVVKMLAKMLHVGVDPPDSRSTFYQPVVFYCSSRTPFFLELFSRTMWLLSRTRREMKASTFADYEKVMYVLQRQVRAALKNKPKDFKSLTNEMTGTSFESVMHKIQSDKEDEMKNLIENHPCIQELKAKCLKTNELQVVQQRLHVLVQGGHFPKVLEKKLHGNIFVKLSRNIKELLVFDVADVKLSTDCTLKKKFKIDDITHVVIGNNCSHANLCPNPALAFSIIVEHQEKIKFIAKDERTACYWRDALLLLINQGTAEKLSKFYHEELNELVVMDIRLQLLELQNIPIPKSPPPVPPLPKTVKPEIPPKPKPRKYTSRIK